MLYQLELHPYPTVYQHYLEHKQNNKFTQPFNQIHILQLHQPCEVVGLKGNRQHHKEGRVLYLCKPILQAKYGDYEWLFKHV